MKKSDLLKLIETLGDDDSVLETLKGVEGLSQFDATKLTVEDFKSILETNEGIKGYNTSTIDSLISKAVDSHDKKFMTEKYPQLLQEELKKVNNKDKTPEQIQLEDLQKKIEQMQGEKTRAELGSKYTKVLTEKGLPADLVDYILGDGNEENINATIEKFGNMFSTITDTKVNEKLMNNSYIPPKDGSKTVLTGVEQAFYSRNPDLAQ